MNLSAQEYGGAVAPQEGGGVKWSLSLSSGVKCGTVVTEMNSLSLSLSLSPLTDGGAERCTAAAVTIFHVFLLLFKFLSVGIMTNEILSRCFINVSAVSE